jgi:hypothetical protein
LRAPKFAAPAKVLNGRQTAGYGRLMLECSDGCIDAAIILARTAKQQIVHFASANRFLGNHARN